MWFFFLTCVVGLVVGRRIGWTLSRALLYWAPTIIVIAVCVLWGGLIAWLLSIAMGRLHPGLVFKVLGFGAGAYVSIPNYGLIREDTISIEVFPRHQLISNVPLLAFILTSIGIAFL
jgi:hypothetical protein